MEICEAPLWRWVGILRAGGKPRSRGVSSGSLSTCLAPFFLSIFMYSFAGAETISIPDIATFEVPDSFTELSGEEIQFLYSRGQPPAFAIGDKKRTTLISYELRAIALPTDQLPEVKSSMETTMAQSLPGLEWKKTDIVKLQGRSWIYFEYVVPGRITKFTAFLW